MYLGSIVTKSLLLTAVLYAGSVVFVHGLMGHPEYTWTSENCVFWPVDLLPKSLGRFKARIMTYGFNSVETFLAGDSGSINTEAKRLLSGLARERDVSVEYLILSALHHPTSSDSTG
jgi:hypothetical protein